MTRREALDLGVTDAQVRQRIGDGTLTVVHPGVYRFTSAPVDTRQSLFAAVLAAGSGAVVSHRAAASVHETALFRSDVREVTVVGRSRPLPKGIVVHRTRLLPSQHCAEVDGLSVTSPARTVVDLAVALSARRIERLVEEWLADRKVTVDELRAVLDDLGTRGRPNVRRVRGVLDGRVLGGAAGDSTDDALLGQVLAAHGFPVPVHNHLLEIDGEKVELDWAYLDEQVAVEVEGYSVHTRSRRSFERLLLKRRLLARTPWTLLEYTAAMVREEPSRVAREVEHHRRAAAADRGAA